MDRLNSRQVQEKRAQAQALAVTLHVGKNGLTDATVAELKGQLHRQKLVKVRLLPSSTEGGAQDDDLAQRLADACDAHLIERRGHTAVFWRA